MRAHLFILSIFLFLTQLQLPTYAAQTLHACGGDGNWPPMSYVIGSEQKVQGLSADILRLILTSEPTIGLRPWARCLAEVQALEGFDVVMSVFKTAEREKQFLFSNSYHSLTPSYLFSATRYHTAPIKKLADLSQFKVCALHRASTSYTLLQATAIESGATNYTSLIKKIDRGYCDIVVDMREVFMGFSKLGLIPFDSDNYRILPLPETEKYPLHFGISKQHPQAEQLIATINAGLTKLQKNGKLASLILNYQMRLRKQNNGPP